MKDPSEYHMSDIHGQLILNYRHAALNDQQTAELTVRAFDRDFAVNGPSTVRIVRTILAGCGGTRTTWTSASAAATPGRPRTGHDVLGRGRGGQALLPP